MDEEVKQFKVKQILKYREEADKADKRAFWETVGVTASLILIGTAHYLSTKESPIMSPEFALVTKVIGGIVGTSLLADSISNNSQRNISNDHADLIEDEIKLDEEFSAKVK